MTPEEAMQQLSLDPAAVMQMSWAFLLGVAVSEFFKTMPPESIHEMVDIAIHSGRPSAEETPPWVFLLALAVTELQKSGAQAADLHQMVDETLKGGARVRQK